jgi:N-acetyl-alpha-D-glucosaminyl L-malate synthase BshA
VQDVLDIFKKVEKSVKSKLLILGDGPDVELVHEFINANPNLINKIKLLGKVDNLYQILKFADVFLLPSEQESFGLAALEAMAAGTPVISSNAGGIPEVNVQGETGFLAEVGNVEAMASYAIKLLSDEKLLAKIKKNAKARALEFDLVNILPIYEKMYEETLEKFHAKS